TGISARGKKFVFGWKSFTTSEWTARHSKSPASAGLFSCFRLLSPSAHKILRRKLSRSPMAPVFQRLHGIFFI
ncbi:hypothetical protein, partial [Ruthenibacterium lactatiformans]|uniref:hypothetical protein n=1 Tax=Ruthenibacterium lactatiformans TaxID=1550024 RepID=UPI00266C80CD